MFEKIWFTIYINDAPFWPSPNFWISSAWSEIALWDKWSLWTLIVLNLSLLALVVWDQRRLGFALLSLVIRSFFFFCWWGGGKIGILVVMWFFVFVFVLDHSIETIRTFVWEDKGSKIRGLWQHSVDAGFSFWDNVMVREVGIWLFLTASHDHGWSWPITCLVQSVTTLSSNFLE